MTPAEILREGLSRLQADIIRRSEEAGQRASGRTYSLLRSEVTERGDGSTLGELFGPQYLGVLEDGRRPGKAPFDFGRIIQEWAIAKGLNFASADPKVFERWANGVAWNIRRRGTVLYREGRQLDIFATPVKEFEAFLIAEVKAYYKTFIVEQIRDAWRS